MTLLLVILNPFLLIATGVLLSESLSASLIAVGAGLLLPQRSDKTAASVVRASIVRASIVRDGALALLALALAAEVRPANAILLPVGGVLWLARWQAMTRHDPRRLIGGLVLVGAAALLPGHPPGADQLGGPRPV